ncbi:NAD(P)H-hydrate dehydratase [Bacillus tianshenii]|nr:NAD(P)H-hydrate dehydratase [Bacillus tianshenii]
MHVVTAHEMYQMDRLTIEQVGLPGIALMENAGRAVSDVIERVVGKEKRIVVLIGTGNNGGDGFVIARTLKSRGFLVESWLIPPLEKLKGDALKHYHIYEQAGYRLHEYEVEGADRLNQQLIGADCIVDTMLGIGVKGRLREPYAEIIHTCNRLDSMRIAVDIPSGVPADSEVPFEAAFRADLTVTIQYPKTSAFVFPHADYYGEVKVVDIGIPPSALTIIETERKCWTSEDVKRTFPRRSDDSHKSTYGKGIVFAGSQAMSGAAVMTAKAAVKSGAGLLSAAVPENVQPIAASQLPEVMFHSLPSNQGGTTGEHSFDLAQFDAVATGPGLGRTEGVKKLIQGLLENVAAPLILDADALYHLSANLEHLQLRSHPTILTPHPGEMARLAGLSVKDVEQNRFKVARQFATENGVYLVLKGRYTIVTTPEGAQYINTTGNAALAKGGSGDVLTGIVLAFVLQQTNIQEAISNAVFLHGKAADWLIEEKHSKLDVMATDLIEALPHVLKPFDASC